MTSDVPDEAQQPIEFTGIIVTYNEARRLHDCLRSLSFCDQILVVDLGSTDSSADIAREYGAEVVHHTRVQVVEEIHARAMSWASNDWIVFLDPDEVLPIGLEEDLRRVIGNHPRLGIVEVPWQFYFRGRPLSTTVWGQACTHKASVRHRDRVLISAKVHRGYALRPSFERIALPRRSEDFCIRHYWVDSLWQMLAKHWRYIQLEGKSRYESGERFRWCSWVRETGSALKRSLIEYDGLRGGPDGIFLSVFYAGYVGLSLISLWRYQTRVEQGHALPDID